MRQKTTGSAPLEGGLEAANPSPSVMSVLINLLIPKRKIKKEWALENKDQKAKDNTTHSFALKKRICPKYTYPGVTELIMRSGCSLARIHVYAVNNALENP